NTAAPMATKPTRSAPAAGSSPECRASMAISAHAPSAMSSQPNVRSPGGWRRTTIGPRYRATRTTDRRNRSKYIAGSSERGVVEPAHGAELLVTLLYQGLGVQCLELLDVPLERGAQVRGGLGRVAVRAARRLRDDLVAQAELVQIRGRELERGRGLGHLG